jgi:ribosomal protein S18 acetylase RimI-like enzyme
MLFQLVNNSHHPLLSSIKLLYESSFPAYERREWTSVLQLLEEPRMQIEAFLEEEQFLGFMILWMFDQWLFLEHFAVEQGYRRKHIGQTVLKYLIDKADNRLILETELATDESALQRIRFYERAGLITIPVPYFQPPYSKHGQPVPMQLMSTISFVTNADVVPIIQLIKEAVYEKFY